MIETYCYLMNLPSFFGGDETKEMSGGGGWVGCLVCCDLYQFGGDKATL